MRQSGRGHSDYAFYRDLEQEWLELDTDIFDTTVQDHEGGAGHWSLMRESAVVSSFTDTSTPIKEDWLVKRQAVILTSHLE